MSSMSRLPFRPVPLTLLLKKPIPSEETSTTTSTPTYTNDKVSVSSLLSPMPVLSPISSYSVLSPSSRTNSPLLSSPTNPSTRTTKRKHRPSAAKPPLSPSSTISKTQRRDSKPVMMMNIEELTYYPVVRSMQQQTRTKSQRSKMKPRKKIDVVVADDDDDECHGHGRLKKRDGLQAFDERDLKKKQHRNQNAGQQEQERQHHRYEHGHGHKRQYFIEHGDDGDSKKNHYMDSGRNWSTNDKVDNHGHELFIPLKKRYMFNHFSSSTTNSSGSSID